MIIKDMHRSQFQLVILLAVLLMLLLTQAKAFQFMFLRNYGTMAWLKGDFPAAYSIFETLAMAHPSDPILHWRLYNIYERAGLTSRAISQLRLSGYDWQTLTQIGDTFLWPAQDWSNALLWYTRAWDLHENSTILFKLGHAYELSGDLLSAMDVYTQALQINTFENDEVDASNALVRLASIYRTKFEDVDKALLLATQSLELNKFGTRIEDKAQAYYLQGEIGSRQGRDSSFCIERYQSALETFPDHYWANLMLGWEYYRAGQSFEVAVSQMRHAISLQPENKWGYLVLADLYVEVGNVAEAAQYYEQVLILAPDDLTAIQFLQNNP